MRLDVWGGVVFFGVTAVASATIPRPVIGDDDVLAPCMTPNYTDHRALPEPPVVDLTSARATVPSVALHVTRSGTHFCYEIAGVPKYVEAPTIRVRKDQRFSIRLIDDLPPSSPAPAMPMAMSSTSPNTCALLVFDPPLPPPSEVGYLGKPRVFATMLPMDQSDTNLHTHGLHVDPDVDNVFKVLSNAGERGETRACTYTFAFAPSQSPGTYWYHSHMHGMAQEQVGGGLAGALIVEPARVQPRLPEHLLLIKDYQPLAFVDTNRVAQTRLAASVAGGVRAAAVPHAVPSFDPFHPPSWPSGQPITTAERCPSAGRLEHLTVNGYPLADPQIVLQPEPQPSPTGELDLPPLLPPPLSIVPVAQRVLYRTLNASSESFVNLRLIDADGTAETMRIVARDGVPVDGSDGISGNPEALAVARTNVLLPPGGRADVIVTGQTRPQLLISDDVCTGYLGDWSPRRTIVEIAPDTNVPKPLALVGARRTPLVVRVAKAGESEADAFLRTYPHPARRRVFTFTQYDEQGPALGAFYLFETTGGARAFAENPFWLTPAPPGHHYMPNIVARHGTTEEWTLVNATGEVHAFHIHQLTFVTDKNPFEGGNVHVRQDVVAIPSAVIDPTKPQNGNYPWLRPSIVVIHMDFTKAEVGTYVYHCHMLFHEDRGMMGVIQVR